MICGKYMFLFLIVVIVFSLSAITVQAIGITPSRVIVNFQPHLNQTFTYTVINNEDRTIDVEMYVRGDLKDYVHLHENSTTIEPGKKKTFSYDLNLPGKLRPGRHDTRIGAAERIGGTGEGGTLVGARAGVEKQLYVDVPFEGRYLEINLDATDAPLGGRVNFTLLISNLGELSISTRGFIEILGPNNATIDEISAGEVVVAPWEAETLTAQWEAVGVERGIYKAIARVTYDGTSIETERSFRIGEFLIDITDASINPIPEGTIGKFEINTKSHWIEEISGVFADIIISDSSGKTIGNIRSESVDIRAGGEKLITAFWDTRDVEPGLYDAHIILHYDSKTTEKTITAQIISQFLIILFQSFVVFIIVLILLLLYYVKIKKPKAKYQRTEKPEKKQDKETEYVHIGREGFGDKTQWVSAADLLGKKPRKRTKRSKKRRKKK